MQTRAQKNKNKVDILKIKYSPPLILNDRKNDKKLNTKLNNFKRKNNSISAKFSTKLENVKRKSSSKSNRKSRSRDKSIESEKKFPKKNGKLKNIILNNNSLKKNLISNNIQKNGKNNKKHEKLEKEEEYDFFDEDNNIITIESICRKTEESIEFCDELYALLHNDFIKLQEEINKNHYSWCTELLFFIEQQHFISENKYDSTFFYNEYLIKTIPQSLINNSDLDNDENVLDIDKLETKYKSEQISMDEC